MLFLRQMAAAALLIVFVGIVVSIIHGVFHSADADSTVWFAAGAAAAYVGSEMEKRHEGK